LPKPPGSCLIKVPGWRILRKSWYARYVLGTFHLPPPYVSNALCPRFVPSSSISPSLSSTASTRSVDPA
jgi:hypothetical protein